MARVIPFESPGVRGFLHRPESARAHGLVLTHGAGGNCRSPLLIAAADAFAGDRWCVFRCDLPFRQRRPTGPPSPATAAADREGLRNAVEAMHDLVSGQVYLGGISYGGRQATMLVAHQPEVAAALLLFSYPLHPPGRPERSRTEHFPRLRAPAIFVQGTSDPFGSIEELQAAVLLISAPTRIIPIVGAGHDLKRGRFDFGEVVRALSEHAAP